MRCFIIGLPAMFFLLQMASIFSFAQTAPGYLPYTATSNLNPNYFYFNFNYSPTVDTIRIFRRLVPGFQNFQFYTTTFSDMAFIDANVIPGQEYEFRFQKGVHGSLVSYAWTGIGVPPVDHRGTMFLVIHHEANDSLGPELDLLESDLNGDGWKVVRYVTSPTDECPDIRNWISNQYAMDPNAKAVFLIGRVPVPQSGNIYPDGHSNHQGAWAADGYYGDVDGVWTDAVAYAANSVFAINHNLSGDGKFDQHYFPSDVELEVGRLDLSSLAGFWISDIEMRLMRQYFQKLHNYKHKVFTVPHRALVDDHFNQLAEKPAGSGFRNAYALVGADNLVTTDFLFTLADSGALFSYGCGPGTMTSCTGVISHNDLITTQLKTVFVMLFGSLFGDWNQENNLMRYMLASPGYPLTCAWAARPHYYLQSMSMGHPIGYATKLSMNDSSLYVDSYGQRMVHMGLMGDPSLRRDVVYPVTNLNAIMSPGFNTLTWDPPAEIVNGYRVYKLDASGVYQLISNGTITTTMFHDLNPGSGINTYMVRAVKRTSNTGGSYDNMSQGVFKSLFYLTVGEEGGRPHVSFRQMDEHTYQVNVSGLNPAEAYRFELSDALGRIIQSDALSVDQQYQFSIPVTPGMYLAGIRQGTGMLWRTKLISP